MPTIGLVSAFPALSWCGACGRWLVVGGDLEGDIIQALKRAIFERGPFISLNGDVTVVRSVGDLQDVTFFLSLLGLLASPPRSIGQQSPFEGNLPFLALFGFCSAGFLLNIGFDTHVH